MTLRALAIWCVMLVCAMVNGAVRTAWLAPGFGERTGHVISTLILCVVIFAVTSTTIRWIGPETSRQAISIGVLWVVLTVAFEFLGGHYLFGDSWEKLFADYDVAKGRIWTLVLVTNLISPIVAAGKWR